MSVRVSLSNPRSYQREAVILFGGGALSGVIASLLHVVAGAPIYELSALSFGATIGLLANLTDSKRGTPMLRLTASLTGAAAMAFLWQFSPIVAGAIGGIFLGGALSLGEGKSSGEKFGFLVLYAVALALGVFVSNRLGLAIFGESQFALSLMTGSVWGLFLAFTAGLKRLEWKRDEIWSEFKDAEADVKGGEGEDIAAGRVLYEAIMKELERSKENDLKGRAIEITEETSRALIAFARRSSELQHAADVTQHRQLKKRAFDMAERLKNARDPQVAREIEATLDELTEQLRVRSRLEVARLRLEARRQRCFTALERLHVSLLQSGGGVADSALEESVQSLERLTDEVAWRNLSVDELAGDAMTEDSFEMLLESNLESGHSENPAEDPWVSGQGVVLDTLSRAEESESSSDGTDGHVSEEKVVHKSSR